MRYWIAVAFLCLCLPAAASKHPDSEYQDAVLKDFHTEYHGSYCSGSGDTNGTVNASTDSNGDTSGTVKASTTTSSSCTPIRHAYYTLTLGGHQYVLTPAPSASKVGIAALTLGIGAAFFKDSALYGVLPGTTVRVRSEGGKFFVRVGKRESEYKLVSAQ